MRQFNRFSGRSCSSSTMAPADVNLVQWQTTLIIQCLLKDEDQTDFRNLDCHLEADSPDEDDFDPVLVADKLRTIADAMNDDPRFTDALNELKQAVAKEAVDKAFNHGVKALCGAEVAPEMQLIKASVTFGLYAKKSAPELKNKVQEALTNFLTRNVGSWVAQQGGWDKVPDVSSK